MCAILLTLVSGRNSSLLVQLFLIVQSIDVSSPNKDIEFVTQYNLKAVNQSNYCLVR